MTQDFAKRHRKQAKKKPSYKSNVPGWVWLFTGSVLGAFVMFLIYLAGIVPQSGTETNGLFSNNEVFSGGDSPPPSEPPAIVTSTPIPATATKDGNDSKKITLEFYEKLKQQEIVATEKPLDREEVARQKNYSCSLQVASVFNPEDAERVRAQLTLLNLNPRIEETTTRNQRIRYRIRIGPFSSSARLSAARSVLFDEGYDDNFRLCPKN